jgi:hypothetical protein
MNVFARENESVKYRNKNWQLTMTLKIEIKFFPRTTFRAINNKMTILNNL